MKMKTVVLLVVAVVLGTAASRVSKRLLSSTVEQSPEQMPREAVVVFAAKERLAAGTVLSEPDRLLEERPATANDAPAQAVHRIHLLRGRRLARPINAKAIITADDLVDEEGASLELAKREGRQAVAIPVQRPGAHLFLPQSRVDVIWTSSNAPADLRVVARDLPLLGLQTRDGKTIATVAAKQDDAEKLGQAATRGTLRLVSRQVRK
jgi:Flp pilus assembly protein CpaB